MKRAILRLTAEDFGRSSLNLGRADENIAVRVEIDLSRILVQEPTATAHINVQNPSGIEYAAATSMDGMKLIWDVTKADNTVEGTGYAQLTVKGPNGEVLKSAVAATRIGHSIRGEGLAPDPVQNWVDDATNKLGSVVQAGEEAEKAASKANAAAKTANTAAGNAQTIANTVQEKLDNGDFVGPAGEPGSDASVTADNIQAALGYTPVKDVQVAGSSVLKGEVAVIPSATEAVAGVIRPYSWEGTKIDNSGRIGLFASTQTHIDNRISSTAIVPTNLDYAVKAAMCDGKGAAWTEDEQKAARDRIGVNKAYELIEEIVLNESVTQVVRANMSLAEIRIAVEIPVSDSIGAVAVEVYSASTLIGYGYVGNLINKENIKSAKFTVKRDRGAYIFSHVSTNANSAAQKAGTGTLSETASLFPAGNAITKVSLYSTSNAIPLPIGTKIIIEGETI